MSIYAPKKPRRINSVSVTITLVLAAAVYVGAWYLPHAYRQFSASARMIAIARDAYREFDDAKLLERLTKEIQQLGVPITDENLAITREPYPPEELVALPTDYARDLYAKRGKSVTVSIAYEVEAKWPLIDKVTPIVFSSDRTIDLTITAAGGL